MWWNRKPKEEPKGFYIEYYPESKFYYALLNGQVLRRSYQTGLIEFSCAEYSGAFTEQNSEEDALQLIKLYKEQQFKENVIISKVD